MRWILLLLALMAPGLAENAESVEKAEGAEEGKVPGVEAVISPVVAAMPVPEVPATGEGVMMAVTTVDPEAQEHVRHGLNCLHGGWDLEAYRHFCEALKLDEDCLMAHWGAAVALVQADPGMEDERDAALGRMLALVDAGAGTELERGYAYGLMVFLREGAPEAANAFRKVSDDFPNDPQLVLLASLFGRGGYDEFGDATPDQELAEKALRDLVEANQGKLYLLYALLAIKAEAPDLSGDLPLARKLCEESPWFPTYFHLLGHYEWRCGNHARAVKAFARAAELYELWMVESKVDALQCPGWTKTECYRAVALASKGDYDEALELARELAAIPVPESKEPEAGREDPSTSRGARMLLWEARTLPVRILMRRRAAGDVTKGFEMLPVKNPMLYYGKASLVPRSYQGYALALEFRAALGKETLDEARVIADAMALHGSQFVKTRQSAMGLSERSEWLRAFKAMEVMVSEARGLLAMAGSKGGRAAAFNWYRSATDHQKVASLMMPPTVLLPMEVRLAEYHLVRGEEKEAVDVLIEGAARWPSDCEILEALETAFRKSGLGEEADQAAERLKVLKES